MNSSSSEPRRWLSEYSFAPCRCNAAATCGIFSRSSSRIEICPSRWAVTCPRRANSSIAAGRAPPGLHVDLQPARQQLLDWPGGDHLARGR